MPPGAALSCCARGTGAVQSAQRFCCLSPCCSTSLAAQCLLQVSLGVRAPLGCPQCRKASPRPSSGVLLGGHITLGSHPHLPVSLEKAFDSFSLVCDPPRLQSCKTWERFAWDRSWPPYPGGTSYTGAHGRIPRAGSAGMCRVLSASRKHNQTSASARQIIPVLQRKRVCFKGSDLITRHCCPSP